MNHACYKSPVKMDYIDIISVSSILSARNKPAAIKEENVIDSFKEEPMEISTASTANSISNPTLTLTTSQSIQSSPPIPSLPPILTKFPSSPISPQLPLSQSLSPSLPSPPTPPSPPSPPSPPIIFTKRSRSKTPYVRTHPMVLCEYCGLVMTSASLKGHYLQHKDNKQQPQEFKCVICGRIYGHLSYLRRHMSIHFDEKQFACKLCFKRFRCKGRTAHKKCVYKKGLLIYQLVHTGEKPYRCEVCRTFFRTMAARRVHRRLHTGERPYLCNGCGKTFTQIGSLKFHVETSQKNGTICGNDHNKIYTET